MTEYRNPAVATDALIKEGDGIILARRTREPFKGKWCLPGGFVNYGERVEDAVKREVREETGLEVEPVKVIGVYSEPDRDPRKHVVNISWLCKKTGGRMRPLDATSEVRVFTKIRKEDLAFDHARVLKDAGLEGMLE